MTRRDVVIVGAGLAGLCCALRLHQSGRPFVLIEASDAVGGRVRTDLVEGFRLDRGFQVLLTAYPEARRVLDYDALDLRPLYAGAMVWSGGRMHRLADPWRHPVDAIASMLAPVGAVSDHLRVGSIRSHSRDGSLDDLFDRPEKTTLEHLRGAGLTDTMIDRFFRPFIGGVFLDRDLATSSRMFEFVFRMFAEGDTAVPARGMGEIPRQIADRLPAGSIRLNRRVLAVGDRSVRLDGGEQIDAPGGVVVATEGHEAARLTGQPFQRSWRGECCLYFDAEQPPVSEPILVLDGEGVGPVNNVCVMSNASAHYAPPGRALVGATVIGSPETDPAELLAAVKNQLAAWFGPGVGAWRHLRTYRIPHALPDQPVDSLEPARRPVAVRPGLFVCGDHLDNASINGAMESGRRAAEALLSQ